MAAWRHDLAERPGEGSLRRGWRLARAAWRALSGEPSVRILAVAAAAVAAAVTIAAFLIAYEHGPFLREGDAWAFELAERAVSLIAATFLLGALAIAVDAAVDEAPLDARDAVAEAWERRGPLLAWGLISFAFFFVLDVVAIGGAPWYLLTIAFYAWSFGTVFVIPALVLGADSLGEAAADSARTVAMRWRQTLAGLLRIGIGAVLALFPICFLLTMIAAQVRGDEERGAVLPLVFVLVALSAAVLTVAAATGQALALLLYRDAEDDLPEVEPAPAEPMRLRRRIALATAAIIGLLILVGAIGALTRDERPDRSRADGYYRAFYERTAEHVVTDGMPIRFRDRTVGHVVEHYAVDGGLQVIYWLRPAARRLSAGTQPVIYNPRPERYVIRLTPTGDLS